MRTKPIYNLKVARDLLSRGYRIFDINVNKFHPSTLVFFFIVENDFEEVLREKHNIEL